MKEGFFVMQFTLGDILMILGYIGGLIFSYIVITNRITRLEVRQDRIREDQATYIAELEKIKHEAEKDHRFLLEKLSKIETSQVETNTFLRENLKSITKIISQHDTEISNLKAKK